MLVITIIIILILAAISINALSNNGLFGKAKTSKEMYKLANAKEVITTKLMTLNVSKYATEGRKAVLTDLNDFDNTESENYDTAIILKTAVAESDKSAVLIYDGYELQQNRRCYV